MTNDIREAIDRVQRYLAGEAFEDIYMQFPLSPNSQFRADQRLLVKAYLAGPAWHDRPTGPGLWVCTPPKQGEGIYQMVAVALTAEDLDRGAPFHTKRVYGPIPEDKPND